MFFQPLSSLQKVSPTHSDTIRHRWYLSPDLNSGESQGLAAWLQGPASTTLVFFWGGRKAKKICASAHVVRLSYLGGRGYASVDGIAIWL